MNKDCYYYYLYNLSVVQGEFFFCVCRLQAVSAYAHNLQVFHSHVSYFNMYF